MRLTEDVRRQLLEQNEGFSTETSYSGKNFSEHRTYTIVDGELHVHSKSKTSWADSRQTDDFVADREQTHRYLRENLAALDTDHVVPAANSSAHPAASPAAAAPPEATSAETTSSEPGDTDETDEDDESSNRLATALIVGGVALGVTIAGVVAAPHIKRWWNRSVKPTAKKLRAKFTKQDREDLPES